MRNIKPKTQSKSFKSRFAHEGPLSQSLKDLLRREDPCHQEQALDCMELTISQLSNPDRNILSGSQAKGRSISVCRRGVWRATVWLAPSQGHTRGSAAKEGEAQRGTKSRLDGGRSQKSSRQDSSLGSNSCWRQTWQSFEMAWKRTTLKPPYRVIFIILPTRLPQERVNFPCWSRIRWFKSEISGREK